MVNPESPAAEEEASTNMGGNKFLVQFAAGEMSINWISNAREGWGAWGQRGVWTEFSMSHIGFYLMYVYFYTFIVYCRLAEH